MDTLHLVTPALREAAAAVPAFAYSRDAVPAIRAGVAQVYEQRYGAPASVPHEEVRIDGAPPVRALLFEPQGVVGPRPALLHLHGGGYIAGTADMMAGFCRALADRTGVVVLSVDYRLAPEAVFPAALDDAFVALRWLHDNAERLDVDAARVGVFGDSAGGALAAGLALRCRDEGALPLAAQLLIYPALDDRTGGPDAPHDNPNTGEFVITREYLQAVSAARVGDAELTAKERDYLAPGRAADLTGLPPTFVAVGSLDLFVEEDVEFALRLGRAAVPIELHVYDGRFHGFDLVPGAIADAFATEVADAVTRLLRP